MSDCGTSTSVRSVDNNDKNSNDRDRFAFLSFEEKDADFNPSHSRDCNERQNEDEPNIFEGLSENELKTPLLAGNELEFESSHNNLNTFVNNESKDSNNPFWDRFKSSLTTQWLDSFHEQENQALTASHVRGQDKMEQHETNETGTKYTSIAAVFLKDFESSRPCSLSPHIVTITPIQLEMYNQRFSSSHQFLLCAAMGSLFFASFFEGQKDHGVLAITLQITLTAFAALIFTMDIVIRGHYDDDNLFNANMQTLYTRKTRARQWKIPMLIMLLAVTLESSIKILFVNETQVIWSSVFKPIVFFYLSSKARDALNALIKVTKILLKIIIIELFLILTFAAMACHLYFQFPAFNDLSSSFLSLFELSTTAVTPSLWIPVYKVNRLSAFFFVSFLIICVFYMHSLVLSIVFQIYIQAMKLIRERSFADRQEALNLAFLALRKEDLTDENGANQVDMRDIRKVMKLLRPHYNDEKIDVLVEIICPNENGKIDFNTFRVQTPKALQTSLRLARQHTRNSLLLQSLAFFIAIANLMYVLLLSSTPGVQEFANWIIPFGTILVLLALCEVILRIRPFACLRELSTSRHIFLDTLAILAALLSLFGLIVHAIHPVDDETNGLQALLLGRALDMIRLLRFSSIFRSMIDRTGDVVPALVGPIALVITSLHIFTYCGMAIWGGAVTIGAEKEILPLYDYNNFNEYPSGLLTMFNIFVVNDWHEIATVYLHADRFNSPYVVYTFFMTANLLGVSILLNVLTAFFVGSFVTKVESTRSNQTDKGSSLTLKMPNKHFNNTPELIQRSSTYESPAKHEFHVFERQGYDSVMRTITGDEDGVSFAKRACELLQVFEKLLPSFDQTGYLVCCKDSNDCFGNDNFILMTKGYIDEDKVNGVVDEMFTQLLTSGDATITKDFPPLTQNDLYHQHLIISASMCEHDPPIGLFVSSKKWISAVV